MMIDYQEVIKNRIFENIDPKDLKAMLSCLSATVRAFEKESFVLSAGEPMGIVGIVMSGRLAVIKENADGSRNIIDDVFPSESFGEAFSCAGIKHSPVSVVALEDSTVLFIDYKRIVSTCSSACTFHQKLVENLLALLADKLIILNNKLDIVSKRRTRDKLLAFFEQQKGIANTNQFTIPFNREELADFLFVDRSAMSSELCKMRDEGLLHFNKNKFELLY